MLHKGENMIPKLLSLVLGFIESDKKLFTVKGKAGTGKTHIIKELSEYFDRNGYVSMVVTPTNKAAGVLRLRGIDANTIHKTLFRSKIKIGEDGKEVTTIVKRPIANPKNPKEFLMDNNGDIVYQEREEYVWEYTFDETKLLDIFEDADLNNFILITDESTMITAEMWRNLIENTSFKIIAFGDTNQLDPVETKAATIRKKIEHYDADDMNETPEELYNALLEEEMLQKQYGRYFHFATADWTTIVNQRTKSFHITTVFDNILSHRYAEYPKDLMMEDVQVMKRDVLTDAEMNEFLSVADIVIAYKNETVNMLNNKIRSIKFPDLKSSLPGTLPLFREGEPLYVTGNLKIDGENPVVITKGEILRIVTPYTDYAKRLDLDHAILYADVQVESTGEILERVPLNINNLGFQKSKSTKGIAICYVDFAYAITCHKAQGSQWGHVVVWDEADAAFSNERSVYSLRKWRYTAITRAQDILTILVK